jgi:ribonuclease P protein component
MRAKTLASRRDFDRVWRKGVRARSNGVVAAVAPAELGKGRVGLIARANTAVDRNRIKRRLRSALNRCETAGMDTVVSGDESVVAMTFENLVSAVRSALVRARRELT